MNYKKVSKKVRRLAEETLTQNDLAHQVIIQKGNKYHAYKDYILEETELGWQVKILDEDTKYFNTAKVALAWCIAHKVRWYSLANTIEVLSNRVVAKQHDIDILTERLKQTSLGECDRFVLLSRLAEDINSRQDYKKQLAKNVQSAKYIKIKGNKTNELNRSNTSTGFRKGHKSN